MAYFFRENVFYNSTIFNLKNKYIILKYSYFTKKCLLYNNFLTISATGSFTFEIKNSRVVENIFYEKINHDS